MKVEYLVPTGSPPEQALLTIFRERDWLVKDAQNHQEELILELIFATSDHATLIRACWFEHMPFYLSIEGPGAASIRDDLAANVPTLDASEAFARFERVKTPLEVAALLPTLSITSASDRPDPRIVDAIRSALGHPDPVVKRAALNAAILRWRPEYRDPVAALVSDPAVGNVAAGVLQYVQSQHR